MNRSRYRLLIFALAITLSAGLLQAAPPSTAAATSALEPITDTAHAMAAEFGRVQYSVTGGCTGGDTGAPCEIYEFAGVSYRVFSNRSGPREHDIFSSNVTTYYGSPVWAGAGAILRMERRRALVLAPKVDPDSDTEVAADHTYVYWTENIRYGSGSLYRVPFRGGTPELMRRNPAADITDIKPDGHGGVLYRTSLPVSGRCCAQVLERVAPAGLPGASFVIFRAERPEVESFTTSGSRVYYFSRRGAFEGPALRTANLAMGDDRLLHLPPVGATAWPAMEYTSDGTLYWQQLRGATGPLFKMDVAGGPVTQWTGNLPRADQLGAAAGHLYVRTGPTISRLPFEAPADTVDLAGQGIEVVQTIQNPAGNIPLISGKTTHVRVYANIAATSLGTPELRLFNPVVLHGSRGGVPLPGSPLRPVRVEPLRSAPVDRTNLATTTLFALPHSWTFGTVELRSAVNTSSEIAETHLGNNESERTVPFQRSVGSCLDFVLAQTHSGTSLPGLSTGGDSVRLGRVMGHVRRAVTLLPTDRLGVTFNPGLPRGLPFGATYNMRDDFHKVLLLARLEVENMSTAPPRGCGNRRVHKAVMVTDSDRMGMALLNAFYFARGEAGPVVNQPVGGVTGLAHEIGHNLGRPHVDCGEPDWPLGPYPYDPCFIDDANEHIGLDAHSRQLIVPINPDGSSGARDFMSYGDTPLWTSDYTYRGLMGPLGVGGSAVIGRPASSGSGGADAADRDGLAASGAQHGTAGTDGALPTAVEKPAALIAGVHTEGGDAVILPIDDSGGDTGEQGFDRFAEQAPASQTLRLRAYDANGKPLGETPPHAVEADDDESRASMFVGRMDLTAAAAVELTDAQGQVLARRSAGILPPAPTIDGPASGEVVEGQRKVSWTAMDPDGDALTYSVRYSADGGQTWLPLASDLAETSMTIDGALLPGSDQARIAVTASDGLHTATAISERFVVPPHEPVAAVFDDRGNPLDGQSPVTVGQSEAVRLTGAGYDPEDGLAEDSDLRWEVAETGSAKPIRTAAGPAFDIDDLPAGSYTVRLVATDTEQSSGSTSVGLVVEPAILPNTIAPALDGSCGDLAYTEGARAVLSYASAGHAHARFASSADALHVCLTGLAPTAPAGVSPPPNEEPNGEPGQPASDVVRVRLAPETEEADETVIEVRTDAPLSAIRAGEEDPVPVGVSTAMTRAGEGWNLELRIDHAWLGDLGQRAKVALEHRWVDQQGSVHQAAWPAQSPEQKTTSWATLQRSEKPAPQPPVVTVPDHVRATATSAQGAVVHYEAQASDPDGKLAKLRCEPPSGTTFPIGTSVVTCTAIDDQGLETVRRFGVTVDPVPQQQELTAVRDQLAQHLPTGDAKADHEIGKAVTALTKALHADRWVDGNNLVPDGGQKVFTEMRKAADHLGRIADPGPIPAEAQDRLRAIARGLAGFAILHALDAIVMPIDVDETRRQKAAAELEKAEDAFAAASGEDPFSELRSAWHHAEKARARMH